MATESTKKGQKKAPVDKAERFRKLASRRVSKLLSWFDKVGNLTNRAQYEYTPAQVASIIDALTARVDALNKAFTNGKTVANTFQL